MSAIVSSSFPSILPKRIFSVLRTHATVIFRRIAPMLLSKPVVATDWSSTTEFCRPEHSIPVPYRMVPVKPGEYFTSMKEWAEIDVPAAAAALRRLFESPALRAELGQKARAFVLDHFSVAAVKRDIEAFLDA